MVDINRRTDLFDKFIDFTHSRYSHLKKNNVHSLIRVLLNTQQTLQTEIKDATLKNTTEAIAFHIPYNFGQPVLLDQEFSEESQEVGYLFLSLYSINMITELNFGAASKPNTVASIFILRPGSGGGKDLVQVQAMYNFKDVSIINVYDYGIYKVLSCRFLEANYVVHQYEGDTAVGQRTFSVDYRKFTTEWKK